MIMITWNSRQINQNNNDEYVQRNKEDIDKLLNKLKENTNK